LMTIPDNDDRSLDGKQDNKLEQRHGGHSQ
jgi:hypothetical protein